VEIRAGDGIPAARAFIDIFTLAYDVDANARSVYSLHVGRSRIIPHRNAMSDGSPLGRGQSPAATA
jgi:hypothetical protein